MEIKQHTFKQPMDQRRCHDGNFKILREHRKRQHNITKLMECSKISAKGGIYSYKYAYIKKREISKIENLSLQQLRELEN